MSQPTAAKKATHDWRYYARWFAALWKAHWSFALVLVCLTVVSTSVSLLFPLFFRHLIDTLSKGLASVTPAQGLALRKQLLLNRRGRKRRNQSKSILRRIPKLRPARRHRVRTSSKTHPWNSRRWAACRAAGHSTRPIRTIDVKSSATVTPASSPCTSKAKEPARSCSPTALSLIEPSATH